MLYALICEDKPDSQPLRLRTRDEHLSYVGTHADMVTLAGPLLSDDGEQMLGSMFIVDAAGRDEVQAFHDADPYTRAGLWARVTLRRFRQVVPPA